jgi:hypothetical protein
MDDLVQNPEAQKLAQMLQQQQMQRFLQSMQGAGPISTADMQMAQMPINAPQADYGMPINQSNYQSNMPMGGAPVARQGLMQGAMSNVDRRNMLQQGMGQGAMSNKDYEMMRRR